LGINRELEADPGVSIRVGIGVHCGPVITGNLGSEDRISYSVTGDAVNTAKRIESATKAKHNSILISEVVYGKTKHLFDVNPWEPMALKGKSEKMMVYEVIGVKEM